MRISSFNNPNTIKLAETATWGIKWLSAADPSVSLHAKYVNYIPNMLLPMPLSFAAQALDTVSTLTRTAAAADTIYQTAEGCKAETPQSLKEKVEKLTKKSFKQLIKDTNQLAKALKHFGYTMKTTRFLQGVAHFSTIDTASENYEKTINDQSHITQLKKLNHLLIGLSATIGICTLATDSVALVGILLSVDMMMAIASAAIFIKETHANNQTVLQLFKENVMIPFQQYIAEPVHSLFKKQEVTQETPDDPQANIDTLFQNIHIQSPPDAHVA